jgi:beta-N-acetylglucosaminidase
MTLGELQARTDWLLNPFLKRDGTLSNKYLNFQAIIDSPNTNDKVRRYITEATGITPTPRPAALGVFSIPEKSIQSKDEIPNGISTKAPSGGLNSLNSTTKYSQGPETAAKQDSPFDYSSFGEDGKLKTPAEFFGLKPKAETAQAAADAASWENVNPADLDKLDVTKTPKLSTAQIEAVISKHFAKSTVITPEDAQGIYDAQRETGMGALAILAIGALESGYGTSEIARDKNNIWGYGATNVNPGGNAHRYSQMSEGAAQFARQYMQDYYNGYGAKSIYSAGTGDNPAGKGYAYFDDGRINPGWATDVGSIMRTFYKTAAEGVKSISGNSLQSKDEIPNGISIKPGESGLSSLNSTTAPISSSLAVIDSRCLGIMPLTVMSPPAAKTEER